MTPNALFMETALGPPKHEKGCADVLRLGCTKMHYVTCRSHRMQKHKFGVTCPGALFVISVPVPLQHENSASTFRTPNAVECTT
jgi:hypothetical protein